MYAASAALETALESHLFWRLSKEPMSAKHVSEELKIPIHRCRCWLDLLVGLGLLERQEGVYAPTSVAREAIIEVFTPETWEFMAAESREDYHGIINLPQHISHPESVWTAQGLTPPDYIGQMIDDLERARRFTSVLYEIHGPLAEKLTEILDMRNVTRLMDLGGGSGVISLAFLQRYPDLTAVVVDLEDVCKAGREIAKQTSLEDRICYHAADFIHQEIPTGFDMILECDVEIYSHELFQKLRAALNPKGRLVIVDWIPQSEREPTLQGLNYEFLASLKGRSHPRQTVEDVQDLLVQSGYHRVTVQTLEDPITHEVLGIVGPVIIQAHK
jgi:N,N-dimethyltransferase/O-methyltransferase